MMNSFSHNRCLISLLPIENVANVVLIKMLQIVSYDSIKKYF